MRIGEINSNNYKAFLQLFGIKSNKTLDKLMGKDETEKGLTEEELYEKQVKMGYIEEGMLIKEGDNSWRKIVPVSDEVRDKIISTVREQFLRNGNGMVGDREAKEMAEINAAYRKTMRPNERLSVAWTLSQIQLDEERRLVNYIQSKDPAWKPGMAFDKNILLNSNFGEGVDVKV